jgi:excisionase family DNA binding protein
MREAAALLGVSHSKIWQLVKNGELCAEPNPRDRRQKLIRLEDLMKLSGVSRSSRRFLSDGAGTNPRGPDAATIKDWTRETWHREP